MSPNGVRPVEILLVEDSPSDAALAIEAFRAAGADNRLIHVEDGVKAMAYLRREGPFSAAAQPDLVLLDLNLPRKDGREVLADIKADPRLATIPVIVLTTSHSDKDVNQSYKLHANCYIVKPVDFTHFIQVIESMTNFWLIVATLPGNA